MNPKIPHAILSGKGKIQNLIMKVPLESDKRIIVKEGIQCEEIISTTKHGLIENKDGFFADLTLPENQNCWLIGFGAAKHYTLDFSLA